jgi:hypothetical protein
MENLFEEIGRIKEIMLYEAFGANKKMVPKYLDMVIKKTDLEKIFNRFLDIKRFESFKKTMISRIQSGKYGNDFQEVSKNLQYLKYMGAILAGLEEVYDNDQERNIEKALGKDFNEMVEIALIGDWCKNCKSKEDVRKAMAGTIGDIKGLEKKSKDELKAWVRRRAGDPTGLLPGMNFFTTHITRANDIMKKYDLQGLGDYEGEDTVEMGGNTVEIEFLESLEITMAGGGKTFIKKDKKGRIPTEFDESSKSLIHKNKDGDVIYFGIDVRPKLNLETTIEVGKVIPRKGGTIEARSGNLRVVFGGKSENKIDVKMVKL